MASELYLCPRGPITDTTDQDPPQAGAQAAHQQGWAFQDPDGASPSVFTWGFWGNTRRLSVSVSYGNLGDIHSGAT